MEGACIGGLMDRLRRECFRMIILLHLPMTETVNGRYINPYEYEYMGKHMGINI